MRLGVDFTGRVIDNRYRVIRKIGEGGMGTVYAGEHVEIGKDVAIKILHPAYSTQQDLVERFRREARAASRIGHPHIIDVTDFGETEDGCAYFVMEHLDGIDLADVLSHERRLAPERACQIAIQICRALAAAHAAGVIHRDLKPENIFLVARDGQADFVKVLDFGIARSMGRARRLTNPGVAMGTPEYMAPEQAEGGAVDQRSDIYLGRRAHLRDGLRLAAADVARQGADSAARDQGRRPRGAGPHRRPRAGADSGAALPEHGAVRVRPGEVAVRALARRLRDAGPARSGARRRAGRRAVVLGRGPGRRAHPRADSPPAARRGGRLRRCAPPAWEEERGSRGDDGGVSRRARSPVRHARRAAAGATRGRSRRWRWSAVAVVPIYRRLPWNAHRADRTGATAPPRRPRQPSEADRRAQRLRAGVADVERMLGSGFGFAQLPALQEQLAAPARRRRHRDRRYAGDAGQGAPGEGGRGGARSRRDRGRRRALPDRAGARRRTAAARRSW